MSESTSRTPATLGRVGAALLSRMPAHLRNIDLDAVVIPEGETPEDRRAREQAQEAGRRAQWNKRLPKRYATASLADVDGPQDPKGRVRRWLDSEALTLVLTGLPGRGKTHMGYAIGRECVERGLWTVSWTAADLNAALRPDGVDNAYEEAAECDVLLWDDLGREKITEWTIEQTQRVLDARNRGRKRTIITTNLGYDVNTPGYEGPGLVERYGAAIVDRIMDDAVVVKVNGESRRKPVEW